MSTELVQQTCRNCTHKTCCKVFLVDLTKEEQEAGVYEVAPKNPTYLRAKSDGSCWYLDFLGNCTIYYSKPTCCNNYHCTLDDRWQQIDEIQKALCKHYKTATHQ